MDEQILAVKRTVLFGQDDKLAFQGIEANQTMVRHYLQNLSDHCEVRRRGDMEEDPSYKQPIPYVVLRQRDAVFLYQRLQGSGESRLHDKLSIGLGGHMNPTEGGTSFEKQLRENVMRELHEELTLTGEVLLHPEMYLINDDSNSVGQVHLGILIHAELVSGDASVRETEQVRGQWVSLSALHHTYPDISDRMETWSQLAWQTIK